MGGGGKESGGPVTIGYHYYLSMHMAICHGPVDYVKDIRSGENVVIYGGSATEQTKLKPSNVNIPTAVVINKPNLYGGVKKEGGVGTTEPKHSTVYLMWGGPKQQPMERLKKLMVDKEYDNPPITEFTLAGAGTTVPKPGSAENAANYDTNDLSGLREYNYTATEVESTLNFSLAMTTVDGKSSWSEDKKTVKGTPQNVPGTVPNDIPSYRGVLSCIWDDLHYQTNSSRPKPWQFKVCRIPMLGSPNAVIKQVVTNTYSNGYSGMVIEKQLLGLVINGSAISSPLYTTSQKLWAFVLNGVVYANGELAKVAWGGVAAPTTPVPVGQEATTWYLKEVYDGRSMWVETGWNTVIGGTLYNSFASAAGKLYPTPQTDAQLVDKSPIDPTMQIDEANPAYILYETITNLEWGMGIDKTLVDLPSFEKCATTLASEEFGLSAVWENESTIEDFLSTILTTINAVIYVSPSTGMFVMKLIREVKDVDVKHEANEGNIIELREFGRMATAELTNQVTVQWTDPILGTQRSATVHNTATLEMQGSIVAVTRVYPAVTSTAVAMKIAARDLAILSQPLAQIDLVVNREFTDVTIGDVIRFSWNDLGIKKMHLRVLSVGYGLLEDSRITLKCVEDIFSADDTVISVMHGTLHTNELKAINPYPAKAFELVQLNRVDLLRLRNNRGITTQFDVVDEAGSGVMILAASPSTHLTQFDLKVRVASDPNIEFKGAVGDAPVVPDLTLNKGLYNTHGVYEFTPYAILGSNISRSDTVLPISSNLGLGDVQMFLANRADTYKDFYLYCGSEFMQVVSIAPDFSTVTVKRGIISSVPKKHDMGAYLWFYSHILDKVTLDTEWVEGQSIAATPLTWSYEKGLMSDELPLQSEKLVITSSWANPYPPANVRVSINNTTDLLIEWDHRDAEFLQDKLWGQMEGTMTRTKGIYYAVRVFNNLGMLLYHNPRWVNTSRVEQLDDSDFDEAALFVAVRAVQGERVSEWNWAAINPAAPNIPVTLDPPAFESSAYPYEPLVIGIADELVPTAALVGGTYDTTLEHWVFEGGTFDIQMDTNINQLIAEQGQFYTQFDLDNWFDRFEIKVMSTRTAELVLGTHYTKESRFTYTLAQNLQDHQQEVASEHKIPHRDLWFQIRVEDTAGNFSQPVSIRLTNPAPLVATLDAYAGENNTSGMPFFKVALQDAVKLDKVEVYGKRLADQTATAPEDFSTLPNTLLKTTSELDFQLPSLLPGKWSFKVRAIDSFGPYGLQMSQAFLIDTGDQATWAEWTKDALGIKDARSYRGVRGNYGTQFPAGAIDGDLKLRFVLLGLSGFTYPNYPVYKFNGVAWEEEEILDFSKITFIKYADATAARDGATNLVEKMKTDLSGFEPA